MSYRLEVPTAPSSPGAVQVRTIEDVVGLESARFVTAEGAALSAVTVNVWALEVPPPGVWLNTVTEFDPGAAMPLERIVAVSWVGLT